MINFIGIGAQKSGTSWAYTCLYEHPEICAPIKEIHFFSRPRFENGKHWYEAHFQKCDAQKLKGEFSTSYLYSMEAAERMYSLYRNVKLIAILRNPVTRAFSQYRNAIKAGEIVDTVSFQAFINQEKSVIEQGRYFEQLERYYKHFPKEQILVLIYEDIALDPKAFMQKMYAFLGIDTTFVSSMLHTEINIARTPKAVVVDRLMHHVSEGLRKFGFDRFVHVVRKTGLPDFVRSFNTKMQEPEAKTDTDIAHNFYEDTLALSKVLNRDLNTEWNIHKV